MPSPVNENPNVTARDRNENSPSLEILTQMWPRRISSG